MKSILLTERMKELIHNAVTSCDNKLSYRKPSKLHSVIGHYRRYEKKVIWIEKYKRGLTNGQYNLLNKETQKQLRE